MSERTDTERLEWLIESGVLSALRRYANGAWSLEFDDGPDGAPSMAFSKSARGAIDLAMDFAREDDT